MRKELAVNRVATVGRVGAHGGRGDSMSGLGATR